MGLSMSRYPQGSVPQLHYQIHGAGQPLILLHGGLVTYDLAYGELLRVLAQTRQVIAVDLQWHSPTTGIDRPFSYVSMADDVAALIEHLGLQAADFLGYSLGGGVALQIAIRHPNAVRRLVAASALVRLNGWFPEVLAGAATSDGDRVFGDPLHKTYVAVAPRPDDWTPMVSELRRLAIQDADWSAAFAAIKAPMLLLDGDLDGVRPAHTLEMFAMLGDTACADADTAQAQWAVLPATDHSAVTIRADLVPQMLASFLDAPLPLAA